MLRLYRFLGCLMLPFLAISLQGQGVQGTFAPTTIARQEAEATMKPLPENGVVMLKTIAGDFASNAVAASAKYSGHRITVVGRIAAVEKGSGEDTALVVTMQDPSEHLPAVKAKFLSGAIPQNSEIDISEDGSQAVLLKRDRRGMILGRRPYLSVDQRIRVRGDLKELQVGDIVLTDCSLASRTKPRDMGRKSE